MNRVKARWGLTLRIDGKTGSVHRSPKRERGTWPEKRCDSGPSLTRRATMPDGSCLIGLDSHRFVRPPSLRASLYRTSALSLVLVLTEYEYEGISVIEHGF